MVTLIKDGRKLEFSEKAAKIAVESLGWSEIIPLVKPKELFTKTKPPEIKLIEPPVLPESDKLQPEPIKDLSKETEVKNISVTPSEPAPDAEQPEVKKVVRRSPRKK